MLLHFPSVMKGQAKFSEFLILLFPLFSETFYLFLLEVSYG